MNYSGTIYHVPIALIIPLVLFIQTNSTFFLYIQTVCCYNRLMAYFVHNRNEEITKLFASLDADGNGVLSPDEVISILKEKLGFDDQMAMFMVKMFDSNNDGNLDKTEFIQMWSSMFGN